MNPELTTALINNSALLLSLAIIYEVSYFIPEKYKKLRPCLSGLLIGLIGSIIMVRPYVLSEGIIFDTRSILISVAAFNFGAIPAVITVIITSAVRLAHGGMATMAGIAVILSSAVIGLLWSRLLIKYPPKFLWLRVYLLGVIVHVVMISCMLLIPYPQSLAVIREISFPVMIIYPIATVLLGMLLFNQRDRNRALVEKVEAESRYRSLFENNHTVMLMIDPENGQILDVNPAAVEYYGWIKADMIKMSISDINTLKPPEVKSEMLEAFSGRKKHFIFKHRRADGSVRDVEVYSGPIILDGRNIIFSIIHDISERLVAERELLESEQRFRAVVEGARDAIFIHSHDRFSYANQAAAELFGVKSAERLLGMPVFDCYYLDDHALVRTRIDEILSEFATLPTIEIAYLKMDGKSIEVEETSVKVIFNNIPSVMVFCRDISQRKQLEREKLAAEEKLRQQQKLESVGTLAGGVAHEINNPLNGIMNYAQLVLDETDPHSEHAQYLDGIIAESRRISDIVKSLLQFSRQDKQMHSYARMDDIINQTLSLIRTIIRKDQIDLRVDIQTNLRDVKCRSQQIQQVLMNLLTNARDALNEKYPEYNADKIITLSCHQYLKEARHWIKICVKDHGNGIPKEISQKIFEPFYSTKAKDIGTGLGLSISFGIVSDHHGFIEVDTEIGKHTIFCVHLPVDNGWDNRFKDNGGIS